MIVKGKILINARFLKKRINKHNRISYLFDAVTSDSEFLRNIYWIDESNISNIANFKENILIKNKFYNISGVGTIKRMSGSLKHKIEFNVITKIEEEIKITQTKVQKKKSSKLVTCIYCTSLSVSKIKGNLYFCENCGDEFRIS